MKWTVTWTPEAEEELTNIWLKAANRDRVSRASDIIETELKHDADKKGTLKKGRRVLHYSPLAVAYEVIPDDCLVRVVHVAIETN
jgi:mRNA-degrading endonuclease RelE of RelBE toxin-antitoxin system